LAEELLKVVKSKYDSTQWASVYEPIAAVLNERDALVGLLRHQLVQNKTVAKHFDEMTTLQDLSDYLLIDVEMSGLLNHYTDKPIVVKKLANKIR
jgi:hypothetical protein